MAIAILFMYDVLIDNEKIKIFHSNYIAYVLLCNYYYILTNSRFILEPQQHSNNNEPISKGTVRYCIDGELDL